MNWTPPIASDFKAFFIRDFNYAAETDQSNLNLVLDVDINKAIGEAQLQFDPTLFGTNVQITNIFMYLAAFYMVENIRVSTKGLSSQVKFPIESNSVGGVSSNFSIPERYKKSPYLASFMLNGYGQKYLQLAIPFTIGNVGLAIGTTTFK